LLICGIRVSSAPWRQVGNQRLDALLESAAAEDGATGPALGVRR